jgi:hypothetical protein
MLHEGAENDYSNVEFDELMPSLLPSLSLLSLLSNMTLVEFGTVDLWKSINNIIRSGNAMQIDDR